MDSDEDVIDLEIGAADLEGMDLDDPPITSPRRDEVGSGPQIQQEVSEKPAVSSNDKTLSSGAEKPRKK